ncbi:hypothetical protein EYF80_061161 [Liparis tanakae]|uniref:Uncharacterized protein n=1 Tax=Liparis tanakae TaxID=230148 RepID=A0A4Z2EJ88_9TELE|nr:hypothetical protein EYF80_061161 [Liparis tanakae]
MLSFNLVSLEFLLWLQHSKPMRNRAMK